MKGIKTYRLKEVCDEGGLEQFLKLRYETYSNSSMQNFIRINKYKTDVDLYDLHSKHFGLFLDEQPVGYVRIVFHKSKLYNKNIFSIGSRQKVFENKNHSVKEVLKFDYPDFPFISYSEIPQSLSDYYGSLSGEKEELVEGSRLTLAKEVRGLGKVKFLIECVIVIAYVEQKNLIINCDTRHGNIYSKQYGFEKVSGNEEYHIGGEVRKGDMLVKRFQPSFISETQCERFRKMVNEFHEKKEITRKI